jgi:hypothetical protein
MAEVLEIQEILTRVWENLLERPSGPLALRFIVQPLVAAIFAVRDGLKDARQSRTPYFWTILSDPAQRAGRLREGFKAVGKIIVFALVLDAIYQIVALRKFYPGEALIIAFVLACVPYLLIRGPVARIARWWNQRGARSGRAQ